MKKYQPLDDRILIKPDPQDEMIGGLLVADENKPKKLTGTVMAVGTGVPLHNIKLNITGDVSDTTQIKELIELLKAGRPMKVDVGDRVVYGQFAGTRLPIDGEEYIMLRESDVFMREQEERLGGEIKFRC